MLNGMKNNQEEHSKSLTAVVSIMLTSGFYVLWSAIIPRSSHCDMKGQAKTVYEAQDRQLFDISYARPKPFNDLAFLFLFTVLLLCGCTTPVTEEQQIVIYQRMNEAVHPVFRDVVEEAFAEGWSLKGSTLDPDLATKANFRLDLDFQVQDKDRIGPERILGVITKLNFNLIPTSCARYEQELSAVLYSQTGRKLKSWRVTEQDTAFIWFFQESDCQHLSDSTLRKIAKNMLKDFYHHMEKNVDFSTLAEAPFIEPPLVYIEAKDSESLVQRIVKTDAPFNNFTFEDPPGKSISYTLTIDFDFVSHDQNLFEILSRGIGSIWTWGLISFCPEDETILNATIKDVRGTVLKQYRFTDSKRASGFDDCTYKSDPAMEERLLRQLFRRVGEDKLI
jgi:hypothetical protein